MVLPPPVVWKDLGLVNSMDEPFSEENCIDLRNNLIYRTVADKVDMLRANFPGETVEQVIGHLEEQADVAAYIKTLDFPVDIVSCEYHTAYSNPDLVNQLHAMGIQAAFWTVATSADQLLGFFEENQNNAAKITVDIKNVYNQLTGGLVINQSGPVTVIADCKSSVAPNGKLLAKGIVLNKEDRGCGEKDCDETILRVRRVTHGEETRTSVIPFSTQTIIDPNLAEGQADVRQQGVNGEKTQVYDVTYVDGVAESETLKSETVTSMAIDQIIAVGAAKSDTDKVTNKKTKTTDNVKTITGN